MTSKERAPLTEPMFYILMSLLNHDLCGTEITQAVQERTGGRVTLGPGTLYTILGKFQKQNWIQEIVVSGRKRTYRITPNGVAAYREELARLHACLHDAQAEETTQAAPDGIPAIQ